MALPICTTTAAAQMQSRLPARRAPVHCSGGMSKCIPAGRRRAAACQVAACRRPWAGRPPAAPGSAASWAAGCLQGHVEQAAREHTAGQVNWGEYMRALLACKLPPALTTQATASNTTTTHLARLGTWARS